MRIVIAADGRGGVVLVDPDTDTRLASADVADLGDLVLRHEVHRPRWVWHDTRDWYPALLAAGIRVERCHDLRLCGAILEQSTLTAAAREMAPSRPDWLRRGPAEEQATTAEAPSSATRAQATLFDDWPADAWDAADAATGPPRGGAEPVPVSSGPDSASEPDSAGASHSGASRSGDALHSADASHAGAPHSADASVSQDPVAAIAAEYRRQLALIEGATDPGRLQLLLAAESAGALIGCELAAAGVPWSAAEHDRVLVEVLGPRPYGTAKPARLLELAAEVRAALDAPKLNPDSQADLLRALRSAGLAVESTARWELRELDHPVIEPLMAYKKLARVLSANGWSWLEAWVADGRFRPEYVPGGTATGRWATAGGGALQLPKQIRRALVADPGWRLVVADAAQLEPRVLAGMSRDLALAAAARGRDLYAGLAESGVVATRAEAKYAMLGALYGATSGESGRLVPRLARTFPRAMALVDRAAADGERGARVTTLLGRSSPLPGESWRAIQSRASQPEAGPADERRARTVARDWGRFTRNFVVQGTAAEWAVSWMASLRARLAAIGAASAPAQQATAAGPVFERAPHLVYFLHDEVIVHTPEEHADAVAEAVRDTAAVAGRLLFGDFPIDFPLDLSVVRSYADAA